MAKNTNEIEEVHPPIWGGSRHFPRRSPAHGLPQEPARLEVTEITVAYNGKPVLQDLTFQVPHAARVAVVGPNGAGKSTLFKAMVGLLPTRSGQIRIHGQPLGAHQDCVAYVPQREEVDWRFPVTVADVVMMGRFGRQGWLKRPNAADRRAVVQALEQMGIADLAGRGIGELSGGQQQRVFLARALAQEPHILLMDEPFTGIDATTQEATLQLLDELSAKQVTAMVSTHDLSLASQRFDLVLLLNRQVIAYGPPRDVFTSQAISRAFGSKVLRLDELIVVDDCCPPDDETGEGHR